AALRSTPGFAPSRSRRTFSGSQSVSKASRNEVMPFAFARARMSRSSVGSWDSSAERNCSGDSTKATDVSRARFLPGFLPGFVPGFFSGFCESCFAVIGSSAILPQLRCIDGDAVVLQDPLGVLRPRDQMPLGNAQGLAVQRRLLLSRKVERGQAFAFEVLHLRPADRRGQEVDGAAPQMRRGVRLHAVGHGVDEAVEIAWTIRRPADSRPRRSAGL